MKLQSTGRGRRYAAWRGIMESVLHTAYRGDWPAHLWSALPAEVTVIRRSLELAPGAGASCRIAFISDLHVGPTTPLSLLEVAFDRIRQEQPDVLLLGGDYVFLEAEPHRLAALGALVASVKCPTKLAVLGNHDLWTYDSAITETLISAGAQVLVNDVAALPNPWADVVVIGLDDPRTGTCDPMLAARKLDEGALRIVLCHSPEGLAHLADMRFDVFLAGHTHGGQIAAPWGPIVLPPGRMCRRYSSGFSRLNSGMVFISRGVGTVELPMRVCAPPDILVLDLHRPGCEGVRSGPYRDEYR